MAVVRFPLTLQDLPGSEGVELLLRNCLCLMDTVNRVRNSWPLTCWLLESGKLNLSPTSSKIYRTLWHVFCIVTETSALAQIIGPYLYFFLWLICLSDSYLFYLSPCIFGFGGRMRICESEWNAFLTVPGTDILHSPWYKVGKRQLTRWYLSSYEETSGREHNFLRLLLLLQPTRNPKAV